MILFVYSNLASSRLVTSYSVKLQNFSFYTYKLGFAFLMNAIGLLIFYSSSKVLSIIFFSACLLLLVSYTWIVSYDRYKSNKGIKIGWDIVTLIVIFSGLFKVLGFY